MTPEQALEMLDRAVALVSADRAGHVALQEAVRVLDGAIAHPADPTPASVPLDE